FQLVLEAAKRGDTWPAVTAGADEAAVAMFLERRIRFTEIPNVIEATVRVHTPVADPGLDDIMDAAAWASDYAYGLVRAGGWGIARSRRAAAAPPLGRAHGRPD
ncbi:MAG: hypothetical protein FJ313_03820, partial [Gemmatimonadetes bacterium]|nr:hypothetical protein [Gemmatimonadota bacterium]